MLPKLQVTREDGRALPPRPTLLVGDAAACERTWTKLAPQAAALLDSLPPARSATELDLLEQTIEALKKEQHTSLLAATKASQLSSQLSEHRQTVGQLHSLLHNLRSLRESLVSNEMLHTPLARQVYELTCDVAAAGGRPAAPELLKGLHGLVSDIYPLMMDPGPRAADLHAAHLLFFSVAPAKPSRGEFVQLLKSPTLQELCNHPTMVWVMQVLAAMATGDWVRLLTLRAHLPTTRRAAHTDGSPVDTASIQHQHDGFNRTPRLLRELLDFQLGRIRQHGLTACAATYRTLPWRVGCAFLGLMPVPVPRLQNTSPATSNTEAQTGSADPQLMCPPDESVKPWNDCGDDELKDASVLLGLCGVLMGCVSSGSRGAGVAWAQLIEQATSWSGDQPGDLKDLIFKQ